MTLHVYLLCHNEEVLLPHTVAHYRRRVPGVTFTILDNESDDRSAAIARELGCAVSTFGSDGKMDDGTQRDLKNTVWREVADGWVIMADMDGIYIFFLMEILPMKQLKGLRKNVFNLFPPTP